MWIGLLYLVQEMKKMMEGMKKASCIYIILFTLELSGIYDVDNNKCVLAYGGNDE